jgi:hypothetical protein
MYKKDGSLDMRYKSSKNAPVYKTNEYKAREKEAYAEPKWDKSIGTHRESGTPKFRSVSHQINRDLHDKKVGATKNSDVRTYARKMYKESGLSEDETKVSSK